MVTTIRDDKSRFTRSLSFALTPISKVTDTETGVVVDGKNLMIVDVETIGINLFSVKKKKNKNSCKATLLYHPCTYYITIETSHFKAVTWTSWGEVQFNTSCVERTMIYFPFKHFF